MKLSDTEINKALALKIGYLPEHVKLNQSGNVVVNRPTTLSTEFWSYFDFMQWRTIMPIAVKYGVIIGLARVVGRGSYAFTPGKPLIFNDIPQRAIALAVLGVKE